MSEKPTAAFVLSLIAGILVLLTGIILAVAGGLVAMMLPIGKVVGLVIALAAVNVVLGILIIVGAVFINSGEPGKVKTGSILVLVLSIISLFVGGGGFFIGFILGLIGGILGLRWRPTQ
ncbi:MAG: hypothetical protein ACP5GI_06745 [Sulfolobales archaeon]